MQRDVIVGQGLQSSALQVEAVSVWQSLLRSACWSHVPIILPPALELAFLLVTTLHRNAVVLRASSGVFNTLLCRQAGYLTPICFFTWVIYSSGWGTVSANESMCWLQPSRKTLWWLFLASRFALGCMVDTSAMCLTCLHPCSFWYFWLGKHRLEDKCSLQLYNLSLLTIKPTNQTKAKQRKPKRTLWRKTCDFTAQGLNLGWWIPSGYFFQFLPVTGIKWKFHQHTWILEGIYFIWKAKAFQGISEKLCFELMIFWKLFKQRK